MSIHDERGIMIYVVLVVIAVVLVFGLTRVRGRNRRA
jgi:hypothetical protein